MITNKKMSDLITKLVLSEDTDVMISLIDLLNILNPTIKNVNECFIIDNNDEIEVNKVNFDRIIRTHGDKTGYEASNNEIRLNDFVYGESVEFKSILALGFNIIEMWSIYLKKKYPDCRFCLIITCDYNSVIIRFHRVRDNESGWLAQDLEQYIDAVAYRII